MREYISLTKISENHYDVYFENKSHLGQFLRDVDGDFYYWPLKKEGCWSAWGLKLISEKLHELNQINPIVIPPGGEENYHHDEWENGTFI